MEIRKLNAADIPRVLELHKAMHADYALDLDDSFAIRNGLFNGTGEPAVVVLGRLTAECFLLMDRSWRSPADRWNALQRLSLYSVNQAKALGIGEVHCFVPPEMERSFGRRLYRQGWSKALWPCFW